MSGDEMSEWARAELEDLLRVPAYGSPEWCALEPADPRRAASVLLAAEGWRLGRGG